MLMAFKLMAFKQDARLAPGYFPPGPSISNPKNPEKNPKNVKKTLNFD